MSSTGETDRIALVVGFLLQRSSSFKSIQEYTPNVQTKDLEIVSAELTTYCNKKVLFTSVYWPDPDNDPTDWLDEFNNYLDLACETYEFMVISGDMNLSKISWDSLENNKGTREVSFLDILNGHF